MHMQCKCPKNPEEGFKYSVVRDRAVIEVRHGAWSQPEVSLMLEYTFFVSLCFVLFSLLSHFSKPQNCFLAIFSSSLCASYRV